MIKQFLVTITIGTLMSAAASAKVTHPKPKPAAPTSLSEKMTCAQAQNFVNQHHYIDSRTYYYDGTIHRILVEPIATCGGRSYFYFQTRDVAQCPVGCGQPEPMPSNPSDPWHKSS